MGIHDRDWYREGSKEKRLKELKAARTQKIWSYLIIGVVVVALAWLFLRAV